MKKLLLFVITTLLLVSCGTITPEGKKNLNKFQELKKEALDKDALILDRRR